MKRIGLIGNIADVSAFIGNSYEQASADAVISAVGGNTGNVAFVYATRKILGGSVYPIGWDASPDFVGRNIDHIVVCCANQLGSHVDLKFWAERLLAFDKPVTLVGLGVQSSSFDDYPILPQGTYDFLDVVLSRRSGGVNIAVRGDFTAKFLASKGIDSCAIGCPSLLISPSRSLGLDVLLRQRERRERVAVAAGNPWHTPSVPLERLLVNIVNRWRGEYILQHPVEMLKYAYGEFDGLPEATLARFSEVYSGFAGAADIAEWFRRYSSVFLDAPSWMRFLGKFDLVLGARYHGVALGVQAGIPGCVFTIDSRTQELCESSKIKSIPYNDLLRYSEEQLLAACVWGEQDAYLFDNNRRAKIEQYRQYLELNHLPSSQHFLSMAEDD